MVSSELETASAIARVVGVPGTRQADFFLDGEVQVLEFDVPRMGAPSFSGRRLAEADLPSASRVVAIIRSGRQMLPEREEAIQPGDRVIVVASRAAARDGAGCWSTASAPSTTWRSSGAATSGPRSRACFSTGASGCA